MTRRTDKLRQFAAECREDAAKARSATGMSHLLSMAERFEKEAEEIDKASAGKKVAPIPKT